MSDDVATGISRGKGCVKHCVIGKLLIVFDPELFDEVANY